MSKGFFMLNQVWILNKTCLSKKYTSFFQKGCNLFSDISSTDLPSLQSYILSNYQIVKPTRMRLRFFDTNHGKFKKMTV